MTYQLADIELGKDGAEWKHGYIPLNAEAIKLKNHGSMPKSGKYFDKRTGHPTKFDKKGRRTSRTGYLSNKDGDRTEVTYNRKSIGTILPRGKGFTAVHRTQGDDESNHRTKEAAMAAIVKRHKAGGSGKARAAEAAKPLPKIRTTTHKRGSRALNDDPAMKDVHSVSRVTRDGKHIGSVHHHDNGEFSSHVSGTKSEKHHSLRAAIGAVVRRAHNARQAHKQKKAGQEQAAKDSWDRAHGPGGRMTAKDKKYPEISMADLSTPDARRSPAVSSQEFQKIAARGEKKYAAMSGKSSPAKGLDDNWNSIVDHSYEEAMRDWGGVTIDSHTGKDVPADADAYALTMREPGMPKVSIPEGSSKSTFRAAMNKARKSYDSILQRQGHNLGVFHDNDTKTIDIDPVALAKTRQDAEDIGAYTHAVGGAYHFKSGNGYWPPHVTNSAPRQLAQLKAQNAESAKQLAKTRKEVAKL